MLVTHRDDNRRRTGIELNALRQIQMARQLGTVRIKGHVLDGKGITRD